jgi:hypothetical protein
MDFHMALVAHYFSLDPKTLTLGDFYCYLNQLPRVRLYDNGQDPDLFEKTQQLKQEESKSNEILMRKPQTKEEREQVETIMKRMGFSKRSK